MTFPREGRAVAISPDGNLLVYAAKNELYLRAFGSAVATQIPGSNDGTAPFFSPDGEWIGFFTTRQLKRVAVSGGLPFVVCDVPRGLSGTWGVDDTIVFSRHGLTGLFRVQASGGTSEQLTTRIDSDGDHDFPDFLPDHLPNLTPKSANPTSGVTRKRPKTLAQSIGKNKMRCSFFGVL